MKIWTPLEDGMYHTDGPEVFRVEGKRLEVYQHSKGSFVNLPANITVCRTTDAPLVEMTQPRVEALQKLLFEVQLSVDAGWVGKRANAPMDIVRQMLAELAQEQPHAAQ